MINGHEIDELIPPTAPETSPRTYLLRAVLLWLAVTLIMAVAVQWAAGAETQEVDPYSLVVLEASATATWWPTSPADLDFKQFIEAKQDGTQAKLAVFVAPRSGSVKIVSLGFIVDWDNRTIVPDIQTHIVNVRGPPPDPDPGPGPGPDPKPPAPFPADGLAVMVIYEASETGKLPPAQASIINNPRIWKWLNDHCVKLPDGSAFARMWDDDYSTQDLSSVPQELQRAYTESVRQAAGRPWIAISTGQSGVSQELPGTVDEVLALLEKWK